MTRIIAGFAKGRPLEVPQKVTRPTTDRVREAIFSVLGSYGGVENCVVLDLYAGSGALGLEALSRGADAAYFVECNAQAVRVIKKNIATLQLTEYTRVLTQSVHTFLHHTPRAYDVVFIDPPYDLPASLLDDCLTELAKSWLKKLSIIVVERGKKSEPLSQNDSFQLLDEKKYGETVVYFLEKS